MTILELLKLCLPKKSNNELKALIKGGAVELIDPQQTYEAKKDIELCGIKIKKGQRYIMQDNKIGIYQ